MRKLPFLILMFVATFEVSAQREFTLGLMPNLYQSTYTNPANLSEFKIHIGLPALSSMHLQVHHSGFAYRDLVERRPNNDTTYLNISQAIQRMSRSNFVYTGLQIDLFSFSYRHKTSTYGFHIREHVDLRFSYPRNLFRLAWEGNEPFAGEKFSLGGLGIDAQHYREYAFLMSRNFGKKLRIGGRLKYMQGLADITTQRSELYFNTYEDPVAIELEANYQVSTSGPVAQLLSQDNGQVFNPSQYFLNGKNWGLGMDIGATYDWNEHLQFSASMVNWGFIRWRTDVANYSVNGNFLFDGVDGSGFFTGNLDFDPQKILDSLVATFEPVESSEVYASFLSPQIFLGVRYELSKNTHASAMLHGEYYRGFRPGLGLGIHQRLGRVLNAVATYQMQSRRFNNLGLGLAIKPGPFQLYFVGDNFQSLLQPRNAKLFNIRLGMNLAIGGKKRDSIFLMD